MVKNSLQQLRLRTWYRASRPFTLSAAVVPVLAGSALAFREGRASLGLFVLVLLASILVQVTTNLVDEYSDHNRPEGKEKLLAPYKVIALGLLSPQAVKWGALVCLSIAAGIGGYLALVAGWPVLVIAVASAAAAYCYSAGPRPLGMIGLGQPLVFLFMGPVMVLGSYYVQTTSFSLDALWLSIPVGCTVTAILAANDLRDLEEDRVAGKMTPVTPFGRRFGRWEWTLLVAAAFLTVIVLVGVGQAELPALLALLALPQALKAFRLVWRGGELSQPPDKLRAGFAFGLRATARLHLYLGFLLAVGVALGRFVPR